MLVFCIEGAQRQRGRIQQQVQRTAQEVQGQGVHKPKDRRRDLLSHNKGGKVHARS